MSLVLCCKLIFIKLMQRLKRTAGSLIPGDPSAVRKGLALQGDKNLPPSLFGGCRFSEGAG